MGGFSLDVFPSTPSSLRRSRSHNDPMGRESELSWGSIFQLEDKDKSPVLQCSEPQPVARKLSPSDAQTRISDAVSEWSTGSEPAPDFQGKLLHTRLRKRSPSFRKIKHRLSRAQSRDRIHAMTVEDRHHTDHPFSAKFTFQDNLMDLVEVDPRMTSDIALYYLQQKLPPAFPLTILKCFYSQLSSVQATQDLLAERGWAMEIPE